MPPQIPYTPPSYKADGFNCPFCHAYARHEWGDPPKTISTRNLGSSPDLSISVCSRCGKFTVWVNSRMVHPVAHSSPAPNEDLSEDIRRDYDEARAIVATSPRGAAALLRLTIQKLCKELGEKGDSINADIAALVKKGLPPAVQQALDVVRVVGNNAVHPGQLDLRDDALTVSQLFSLVNLIADVMVSQPRQVKALYETVVPEEQRRAIERRDGPAT